MGDGPAISVANRTPVSIARSLETAGVEADLDANNGKEKEKEKATDISVPKHVLSQDRNKMNNKQVESIIESEDTKPVGNSNIVADEADNLEPNSAAKSDNTCRLHDRTSLMNYEFYTRSI